MSDRTYKTLWSEAHGELSCVLARELSEEPVRDRGKFFQKLATLYVLYLQIFRKLEEAYDQSVHPQKRRVMRQVLEGVMGRILELKNEMVEYDFSEYHYMDDIIQDLKLIPEDLEIPVPRYFIRERKKELEEREEMFATLLNQMESIDKPEPPAVRMSTLERSINRERKAKENAIAITPDQAAVTIQKVWRGFVQRKNTKRLHEEETIFLRMAKNPKLPNPSPLKLAVQNNEANRRKRQEEYEDDYQKSISFVTELLWELESQEMKEIMKDQIRQWSIECRDGTGSFPDYPEEEDGGSALIFAEKTPEQRSWEPTSRMIATKDRSEKEEMKEKEKRNKGKAKEAEKEPGLRMRPSAFLEDLKKGHKRFSEVWKNKDESKNFSQRHEMELLKEEKRKVIKVEIRKEVDEVMRQELANLKLAVDKEKSGKSKGAVKKKAKKEGIKKGKVEEKQDKVDLTSERTLKSLFEELVQQKLLKKADHVKLKDYLGDYSYLGTTRLQSGIEPKPSLSDVRQVVALYAVLPLGSQVVHEKAPLVKSMLLVGPSGVGKKMLVHAICQETGANLFDLSPSNVSGKYPGKSGLQMMLQMVFMVARLMQPSVIWIGDAEKMFYKNVPKDEKELDPKRLTKNLSEIHKSIKGEDCILIVGTTNDPQRAELEPLCEFYNKIILIPRSDYASRHLIWRELIRDNGGEVTSNLDLSFLTKISEGCTPGHMVKVVCSVLSEHRIQQLPRRPLTASEFVSPLAGVVPEFHDEEEALKNWYSKTPLCKRRCTVFLGKEGRDKETPPKKGKGGMKKVQK
ncbi:dynein regulatory complex protein 11-like [Triplophysa dalaica]|uniref:dynein regulatory complex protein 11-like n=1 Tax=Triplophysa dalaica TaxID=1582913 RepID=UPI0024DF584E|nr:dynein regulatory complex protein 11-like [Triplophysa dalaica]